MSVSGAARRPIGEYDAYLFDVDGTLLYVDRCIAGAVETIRALKCAGKRVLAVTNNSSFRRHEIADRFRAYGLPLEDSEVFSALVATARLAAREKPGARVYVFGNEGLRAEARACGLEVVDHAKADYVLVGTVKDIDYDKLTLAMRAVLGGARCVAVNADQNYVGADGQLVPGAGAFVGALEGCTGRRPEVIVGKPAGTILCEAANSVGVRTEACVYVGDYAAVDIVAAHAAGMDAILVLSGVTRSAEPLSHPPEYVLPSVADLERHFRS